MIQAEIHSKLNVIDFDEDGTYPDLSRKEDVLTSNIFGILKNLDVVFLNEILKTANIPHKLTDKGFRFKFWPVFEDGTEPDLLIEGDDFLIVIEVKYFSDFDHGTSSRKAQILREFEGAQKMANSKQSSNVHLLMVTRMATVDWKEKVQPCDQQAMTEFIAKLHSISWSQIYSVVKCTHTSDDTSLKFQNDLIELMENKQIGHTVPNIEKGTRVFLSLFGDKAKNLDALLKVNNYKLDLAELPVQKRLELYECIRKYIESLVLDKALRPLDNVLSTDVIPVDLLLGVPVDERQEWIKFILFLFTNKYVNLNGKNDCSVRLHFRKGNYTKSQISLFRYRRVNRIIEFNEYR